MNCIYFLFISLSWCLAFAANDDCQEFTIDRCTVHVDGVFETINDVNEETCQEFCDVIYHQECEFFIYDRKEKLCQLMRQSLDSFIQTCKKAGGPREPSVEVCKTNQDPCIKLMEGYCLFHGSILETLGNVSDVTLCQLACTFLKDCQYFFYDIPDQACQLYDSQDKDCDFIIGPPSPSIESCRGSETTTSTTSTTTTQTTLSSTTTTSTSTSTQTTTITSTTTTSTSSTTPSTTTTTTTTPSTTTTTLSTTTTPPSTTTTTISTSTTAITSSTTSSFHNVVLIGGKTDNEGNVYATNPTTGVYGPVCHDNWSLIDAEIVCRQLGYPGAERHLTDSYFGTVPNRFSYDDVTCSGNESTLDECSHQDYDDCYPTHGAGVVCRV